MKTTVSPVRHIAKAITYRILGTLTSFFVGWSITGSMELGLSIGIVDFVGKTVLYYIHERLWYRFSSLGVHYEDDSKCGCGGTSVDAADSKSVT